MKQKLVWLVLTALCVLFSSCSPKPISGQVSVVTQAGANVTFGAVQVEVISARDADDFMTQCQDQINAKTHAFKESYDHAKSARDAAARVESQTPTAATIAALAQAGRNLNDAATALKNFPTPNDYFEGFYPTAIETTMTDAEGNFTIERPKNPAKVFAKAERQMSGSVEDYFWLVDVPATGGNLILNSNNMFKVLR